MGTLKNTNEGWNRERFVETLVGRVAYIQSPDKSGDDFGVDLIGFFKVDHPTRSDMYVPSLPFHVQVKPKNEPDFIAKHIHELTQLYAPFYFAVGNTKKQMVTVYSGLGILGLCMLMDREELRRKVDRGELRILLELTDSHDINAGVPRPIEANTLVVDFYKVAELTTASTIDSEEVRHWRRDCSAILRSIESYNSGEFVLDGPDGTVFQVIGNGTYSHAVKRMLHASAMIAQVINDGNSAVGGVETKDLEFLTTLGHVAEYMEGLPARMLDTSVLSSIVVEKRWEAWSRNVMAIAKSKGKHR